MPDRAVVGQNGMQPSARAGGCKAECVPAVARPVVVSELSASWTLRSGMVVGEVLTSQAETSDIEVLIATRHEKFQVFGACSSSLEL